MDLMDRKHTDYVSLGEPGDPLVRGETWNAFCDALRDAGEVVLAEHAPGSPTDRAEGYRYLTRLLQAGLVMFGEFADRDYPEFGRVMDTSIKWGLDNVDALYSACAIRGTQSYRIRGTGGSAHYIGFYANFGQFGDEVPEGSWAPGGTTSSISNIDDLSIAADGSFEIAVGPEAPADGGNWLRTDERTSYIGVRQFLYDWERERPWYLTIERVGQDEPPPPLSAEAFDRRLRNAIKFVNPGCHFWDWLSRIWWQFPPNAILMAERGRAVTDERQHYGWGRFLLEEDQALVVSFTPPDDAHYWGFQLYNWWGESFDYTYRQSSLNGHQARPDGDGVVRLVIARSDPGVANWVDPAGHREGILAPRFLGSAAAPTPECAVVPLAELRAALPEDTLEVTADERREGLRRRRDAVWRRFRD